MRTITVTTWKGGVGKTSHSVNLAGALAKRGKRVLVIDFDAQRAGATNWLCGKQDPPGVVDRRAVLACLMAGAPLISAVRPSASEGIDVVSSPGLALGNADNLNATEGAQHARGILRELIAGLPARWDFVIIDCRPGTGVTAMAPLVAADEIIAPLEIEPMAVEQLFELVRYVDASDLVTARFRGVCPIKNANTKLAKTYLQGLKKALGKERVLTRVRQDASMNLAYLASLPVTHFAPTSRAAKDYGQLAEELLAHWAQEDRNVVAA